MTTAVVVYAFTLGLVAAVNPCGFPLLPAYLAVFTLDSSGLESPALESQGGGTRVAPSRYRAVLRALAAGGCVSIGFVVTFGVVGILVSSGMSLVIGWVPWIMVVVGAALLALGIGVLTGRWHGLVLPALRFRSGRGAAAMTGFGVAYGVGSLSCALPLFLAGVVTVFTGAGFAEGAAAFVAYALGMGLFVTAAGLVVALLGVDAVRALRGVSRFVPRIGGVLVALVGAYLVYYWVGELTAPTVTSAPVRWVDAAQSSVSSWLSAAPAISACVLSALVIVGLGVAGRMVWRRAPSPSRMERND